MKSKIQKSSRQIQMELDQKDLDLYYKMKRQEEDRENRALVFTMNAPLSDSDEKKISELLNLTDKIESAGIKPDVLYSAELEENVPFLDKLPLSELVKVVDLVHLSGGTFPFAVVSLDIKDRVAAKNALLEFLRKIVSLDERRAMNAWIEGEIMKESITKDKEYENTIREFIDRKTLPRIKDLVVNNIKNLTARLEQDLEYDDYARVMSVANAIKGYYLLHDILQLMIAQDPIIFAPDFINLLSLMLGFF